MWGGILFFRRKLTVYLRTSAFQELVHVSKAIRIDGQRRRRKNNVVDTSVFIIIFSPVTPLRAVYRCVSNGFYIGMNVWSHWNSVRQLQLRERRIFLKLKMSNGALRSGMFMIWECMWLERRVCLLWLWLLHVLCVYVYAFAVTFGWMDFAEKVWLDVECRAPRFFTIFFSKRSDILLFLYSGKNGKIASDPSSRICLIDLGALNRCMHCAHIEIEHPNTSLWSCPQCPLNLVYWSIVVFQKPFGHV